MLVFTADRAREISACHHNINLEHFETRAALAMIDINTQIATTLRNGYRTAHVYLQNREYTSEVIAYIKAELLLRGFQYKHVHAVDPVHACLDIIW